MEALPGCGEEGVGVRVGTSAGDPAAEPSPSDLGGGGPGEVEADGEASGQDEGAARGVVAQGHQLEGEGLVLTLEALAGEPRLHTGEDAAREEKLGFPPARTHGAVTGDDGLGVADGGGGEAGEEAVLARVDRADAGLAPDDAVEDSALEGQRGGEGVRDGIEAGDESADAPCGVAGGEEARGLELDEGGAGGAGQDPEGGADGIAVGLAGVGRGRGPELGESPCGAGGRRGTGAIAGARSAAARRGRRRGVCHRDRRHRAVERGDRARVDVLEAVEVARAVLQPGVAPGVARSHRREALARDERRRQPRPGAQLRRRAVEVKAEIVHLGARLPGEIHCPVPSHGREGHQPHRGRDTASLDPDLGRPGTRLRCCSCGVEDGEVGRRLAGPGREGDLVTPPYVAAGSRRLVGDRESDRMSWVAQP